MAAIALTPYIPRNGILLTQDPIGLAGGVNLYAYAGNNPVAFSDPWGLDIVVRGEQSKAIVAYLLANSETFRDTYAKLDRDSTLTLTISDATGIQRNFPSQFSTGCDRNCSIYFSDRDLNQGNMNLVRAGSKYIYTAASVMAHEMGHAAGHFSETTGVDTACAGDPPQGGTGCVLEFENTVRSELPAGERGGVRDKY